MKMYTEKEPSKSWALRMQQVEKFVCLQAVDATTGEILADILSFKANGTVHRYPDVSTALQNWGYDPYEHGNSFDENGYLTMTKF